MISFMKFIIIGKNSKDMDTVLYLKSSRKCFTRNTYVCLFNFHGLTLHHTVRFCEKCVHIKPDRCHHCSVCGVCVLKMDRKFP